MSSPWNSHGLRALWVSRDLHADWLVADSNGWAWLESVRPTRF